MRKQFKVGLSFSGDMRENLVSAVARSLAFKFACENTEDGKKLILYDLFHQDQFNQPVLSEELPSLYLDQCEVIAVFLCAEYARRHWCGLEWEKIKELAMNPSQRKRIYLIWQGPEDDKILNALGLDRKVDGIRDFSQLSPADVAEGIWRRWIRLSTETTQPETPIANEIGLPAIKLQSDSSIDWTIQRLAIALIPPVKDDSSSYLESDRYEIGIYISNQGQESYTPFHDLNISCQFLEARHVFRDWTAIAQSLAFWVTKKVRGNDKVIVELFLPYELMQQLLILNFLNTPCHVDPGDDFVGHVDFASLCPITIRPLDRYLRQSLSMHIDHLRSKFSMLLQGRGKWIHGRDAESSRSLIAKRDSPHDVAVRMLGDLPMETVEKQDWLKKLIGSMVPFALWWAAPGERNREAHLQEYKCEDRKVLEIGTDGVVAIKPSDLDLLPLERKRLNNRASSLILMIDNPQLVPQFTNHTSRSFA
ncbi:MAG: hypothetical protein ACK587_09265 [Cyanobacteriota bacterium]